MKKHYELLEHTADIAIRVSGNTLPDLFKNAAAAMFDIMAGKKRGKKDKPESFDINLKAPSLEDLFQNWLGELLSLSAAKDLIFEDFKISELSDNNIIAKVTGSAFRNYSPNIEIKAVTYHELKVEKAQTGWQARVIFDV